MVDDNEIDITGEYYKKITYKDIFKIRNFTLNYFIIVIQTIATFSIDPTFAPYL